MITSFPCELGLKVSPLCKGLSAHAEEGRQVWALSHFPCLLPLPDSTPSLNTEAPDETQTWEWMDTDTQMKSLEHRCIIYVSRWSLEHQCLMFLITVTKYLTAATQGGGGLCGPQCVGGIMVGKSSSGNVFLRSSHLSAEKTENATYRRVR